MSVATIFNNTTRSNGSVDNLQGGSYGVKLVEWTFK